MAVFLILLLRSIDMENYFAEQVRTAKPLGGQRLALAFADGFAAEIDLALLLYWGPLYEPLRDEANFRKVTVSAHGVPEWDALTALVSNWLDTQAYARAARSAWALTGRAFSPQRARESVAG